MPSLKIWSRNLDQVERRLAIAAAAATMTLEGGVPVWASLGNIDPATGKLDRRIFSDELPSLERPGSGPRSRPSAAVARGPVREPNQHAFANGHGVTFRDADNNAPAYVHGMSKDTMRLFQEYHDATMPEAERRLGTTLVPIGRSTPLDGPRENTTSGS